MLVLSETQSLLETRNERKSTRDITSCKEIWNSVTEQLEFIDGLLKVLKMPYPLIFSLCLTHNLTASPTLYPAFEKQHVPVSS